MQRGAAYGALSFLQHQDADIQAIVRLCAQYDAAWHRELSQCSHLVSAVSIQCKYYFLSYTSSMQAIA